MGEFLAILALVMFSINIIITNIASKRLKLDFGFLIAVAVNVLFSLLLFFVHLVFFREESFHWHTIGFFLFLISGFFSTYLGRYLFFETIAKMGPAKASAFQVNNPLFTFLIAWLFLDEVLTAVDFTSIFMILAGLFLVNYIPQAFASKDEVAATNTKVETEKKKGLKNIYCKASKRLKSAVFLAILSALFYSIGNVLRGSAIEDWNEPIFGAMIGAVMGLLAHILFNPNTKYFLKQLKTANSQGIIFYMASGILTISAQICLIASMWYIPVSIANLITLSTPVLVTPLSFFLLKNQEGISIQTVIGILMVLFGISVIVIN
jgi:drug/metabolite transporter (DMT)-like permease